MTAPTLPPPGRRPARLLIAAAAIFVLVLAGFAVARSFGLFPRPGQVPGVAQSGARALKIYTAEDGIYALSAADLRAAGFALSAPATSRLQLSLRGQPVSLWVDGQGDGLKLYFYGQASRSIYTQENVYWLEWLSADAAGPSANAAAQTTPDASASPTPQAAVALPPDTYLATVRQDQNKLYNPQVDVEPGSPGDHWLWVSLAAPQTQAFDFPFSALASGPGRLRVRVWASTDAPAKPNHHLVVKINGQPVADEQWDGKGHYLIQASLPAGVLREGSNRFEISAPGDTGVAADITFLDWIEVDYPRRFTPENDRLEFVSPGGSRLWAGFSGPLRFFDVTDPQAAARLDAGQGGVFNETAGRRYWAIGPQGYRKPSRLALPAALDLRAAGSGADYVAIGPADLLEPLQPLLDWRSQRGLKTKAIPLEAVYDQFNYGMPEPEAIRTFLKAAAKSWQPAPHYVLLVGDATYDPRGYLSSPDANRLPTFLVSTIFGGETASDLGYAVLEGDAWPAAEDAPVPKPALAVGRMPARDPKQVADVVEKTLAYEKAAVDPVAGQAAWRKRVLAIADGQDPSFRLDAQAFLDSFQGQYQTDLYSPQAGASDANAQIRDRLGRGDLLVAYFGHGSINMWGKDRLFSNDDVKLLADSDNLPVIINMTCLVGLFTHPKVDSLAETLLWQPGGGAVAVLAATSLTLPNDQSFLSKPLAENLLGDSPISLGDLLLRARQQVPADSPGTRDVLQTFLLFGDPALTLK